MRLICSLFRFVFTRVLQSGILHALYVSSHLSHATSLCLKKKFCLNFSGNIFVSPL